MICRKLTLCVDAELTGNICPQCDNDRAKCIISSDSRSEIKCEEKSKKYILKNTMKNHVISYRMDGGIVVVDASVPAGVNKCDYLLIDNAKDPIAILVELKGVNVLKALKQIYDTLVLYKDLFGKFSHVYGRIIVTCSTPDLKASPEYVKLEKLIKGKYKGNVRIEKQKFSEPDTDLLGI